MAEQCEGCAGEVRLAGGIANIWTTSQTRTGGMTLEFTDDTEFFLCFDCIDALPDDPGAGDVDDLRD
ncbi:DUF7561 family protein [Halobacterium wangiae]|uniref:DUF7561 family protein n=1 Tax=Halobacterium wangiae TaxID=2902623 RepID=UPI001E51BEC0|nr:hypothetical protein [Halobacterium wangiae]